MPFFKIEEKTLTTENPNPSKSCFQWDVKHPSPIIYNSTSCHTYQNKVIYATGSLFVVFFPLKLKRIEMMWEWFWFLWIKGMIKN